MLRQVGTGWLFSEVHVLTNVKSGLMGICMTGFDEY